MSEHSERIVIWGQSCVGKTTFAQTLSRPYLCFDALFPWNLMETLGLSFSAAMQKVKAVCDSVPTFVLDGWHLGDKEGVYLPNDCVVYVLYAPYAKIIQQYRVPVSSFHQHWHMFEKWYGVEFPFPTRYFFNSQDGFIETSPNDFIIFQEHNLRTEGRVGTLEN